MTFQEIVLINLAWDIIQSVENGMRYRLERLSVIAMEVSGIYGTFKSTKKKFL